MATGDHYRAKALELLGRAEIETDSAIRRDLEAMAASYLRLTEQAERNIKLSGIAARSRT